MAVRRASEPPPPARLAELERSLAGSAPLARAYLVRGEERWFREAALALLGAEAQRRGFQVARHDAADPDLDLAGLLGDLSSPSLFAPASLVVVRNAAALQKRTGESEGPFTGAALAFLRASAVPGSLVLEAESLRVDSVLAKAVVEAGGEVLSLRRLYDSPPPWERNPDPGQVELVQWLVRRAKEKSLRLDPSEAAYVAAATGNDLGALDAALDRLAGRGERGVRETVAFAGAPSPFDLAEDLLRGDAARSLSGAEALLRSGMREKDGSREVKPEALLAVLFGTLRAKLRQSLAFSRAAGSGARPEIQGSPRAREEIERRTALRPPEAWRAMLGDLARLERATRTSRTVDVDDLALLALRWRLDRDTIRPRGRGAKEPGRIGA
jgi:DNA polymerase III delta subunit